MQHVTPRYAIFIPSIVLFTCGGYAAKKRLERSWGRAGKGGRELVLMQGLNSQRWWISETVIGRNLRLPYSCKVI